MIRRKIGMAAEGQERGLVSNRAGIAVPSASLPTGLDQVT